ncbi:hypothetical protein [Streptomyces sp. NPDC093094]|uniref:hypothetical protein n=1 Tax=Streptomyces sp. NPDC093094 TaxID=3366026 RepID=UPI0037F8BDE8
MTEHKSGTSQKSAQEQEAASKARRTADKATAPAGRAAKKAAATTDDTVSGAKAGTQRAVRAGTERAAGAVSGAARTAAQGVESGRQALVTASGEVASVARTAWTVIANRKLVAAGVGAGVTALGAASYALGRRAERHTQGPLTRLTNGRM